LVLWALAIIAAALVVFLVWSLWYRTSDHTGRLLAEISPLSKVEEQVLADSGRYKEIAFTLTDELGRVTRGELRLPAGINQPQPALLILGGHGTGAGAVKLIRLETPGVICAMDYPSYSERKVSLIHIPSLLLQLNTGAWASVGMTATVLEYLYSRPEVDTSRVSVLGASFGVPFAVLAAALDRRLDGLVLIHGAADLEELIDWNLRRKIGFTPLRKITSYILGTLTAPFEPSAYIDRLAPRPLLMVNSRDDEKIPGLYVNRLYQKAKEPKEIVWLDSGHIHPSNRKLIDSLTLIVSNWLEKNGLL